MPKPNWLGEAIVFALPNPAAGANVVIQPAAGTIWLLIGVAAAFTTDATVANRQLFISQFNGISNVGEQWSPALETASTTAYLHMSCLFTGVPYTIANRRMFPMGYFYYLSSAIYLTLFANNIQAGDQWSGISLNCYRMLDE